MCKASCRRNTLRVGYLRRSAAREQLRILQVQKGKRYVWASKTIAITLAVIATLGFVAAGLALFGVLVPFDWWRALAIASAAVSLLLVVIFWHPYLIVGLLIDVAVLVTLLFTKWSPG